MSTSTAIDIQMPVRRGGFIIGDVLARLLTQDIPVSLFVDASEDFAFDPRAEQMLHLISENEMHARYIRLRLQCVYKRNRLRHLGTSPFIYLADPDVLPPAEPALSDLVASLQRDPELGAIGFCYQPDYREHVATGSMMLHRDTIESLGAMRDLARFCDCDFIKDKLALVGRRVEAAMPGYIVHLRDEYQQGYPDYKSIPYQTADGGVPREVIDCALDRYGVRFKLFPETPS